MSWASSPWGELPWASEEIPASGGTVTGTLTATETTVDIFAASGGSGAITGTLSVTESGPDVFSCSGTILVSGSLTATESTSDTLSISGVVLISGTLGATGLLYDRRRPSGQTRTRQPHHRPAAVQEQEQSGGGICAGR